MPSGRVPKNNLPLTNYSLFISILPFNAFIGLFHSVFISSMSIKSAQHFCLLLASCFQYLPSSLWGYLLCLFKTLIPWIHQFCFLRYRFFRLLPFFHSGCPPQTSHYFFLTSSRVLEPTKHRSQRASGAAVWGQRPLLPLPARQHCLSVNLQDLLPRHCSFRGATPTLGALYLLQCFSPHCSGLAWSWHWAHAGFLPHMAIR